MSKSEKTNIEILRGIHKQMAEICPTLVTEAEEFLDAIEEENIDKADEITKLKLGIAELENDDDDDDDGFDYNRSDFVGLDTISWSLGKGNLNVEMRMEAFIKQLQRENAVVPA